MQSTSDYRLLAEETINEIKCSGREPQGLYAPVEYSLMAGGKRLRPILTLMATEAFGGDPAKAAKAAVGLEMFHNFTLLHDDVMDNSDLRRGRETVHKKWDVNTAILSGDAMLTLATELMSEVEDGVLREVLERFNRMALEVYEGQALDMAFESRTDITPEQYIEMITLKTGALLGAAAAIGALIAGADKKQADRMDEYGRALGVAFQIQDDWLDVFGDPATFGKPIGGDINNGKKAFFAIEASTKTGPDAEALATALELPAGDGKVNTVRKIYERMGLDEAAHKAVGHWSGIALKALKKSGISQEGYDSFRALADKLTGRKK